MGAVSVYYVILTQVTYPIILAIAAWISGNDYVEYDEPTPKHFSPFYTALLYFFVAIYVTNKKDLSLFVKFGSMGSFFVMTLMLFIIVTGILALGNTSYTFGTFDEALGTDWMTDQRTLVLYNSKFSPLAGILCAGYFLHTCSLSIIRTAKFPEKANRDIFIGYCLVFVSYITVGTLGYIGFIGTDFRDYYVSPDPKTLIDENCLNMFKYSSVPAFVLRIAIFFLLFSSYPLLCHFLRTIIFNLFFRN